MYISDGTNDVSFSKKVSDVAMHAAQAWIMLDAQPFKDADYAQQKMVT